MEYDDPGAAERAMQTLNGRRVHQAVSLECCCVSRTALTSFRKSVSTGAYQSNTSNKEDTSNHFHIFVGDLSNEVNDEVLLQAFSAFGSVSEARVMWDMKTGRSRGYGFVAFRERQDAEKALSSMDGEWLGSRAIRCNWANQKGQPSISQQQALSAMGMTPTTPFGHHHFPTHGVQSYDMIVQQTPAWQTTCYVGNLTPYTTQNDLVPLFQNFGYVVETRFQADRGFAFVKMDNHENAAMAICQLSGYNVNGRPLKCSVRLTHFQTLIVTNLTWFSGAKTRHLLQLALTDLSKATALKAAQHLVDIQELHPLIFLNMVVCLSNQDHNQPDRWLTNNLQASSLVSKAAMVDHLPNPQVNILISRWGMEVLLVLVVMGVVLNKLQTLNGVFLLPKASGTDLVGTKDKHITHLTICQLLYVNVSTISERPGLWGLGISLRSLRSLMLHSFWSVWHGFAYGSPFSRQSSGTFFF